MYSNTRSKKSKKLMILGLIAISLGWIVFKTQFYSTVKIMIDPVLKDGELFFI